MAEHPGMAFIDTAFGQIQLMNAPWVPVADVSETDDASAVEVELPGVQQHQINVELSDGVLPVKIPKAEEAKPRRVEVTG